MPRRDVPARYKARIGGLFALTGGPLCGLTTDQNPKKCPIAKLWWEDLSGHGWMLDYRFNPDELRYEYVDMARSAFG